MSVAKVIEISAESDKSFEDAIRNGVAAAAKTVRNVKSAWIDGQQAIVENGAVKKYRVDMKVSFVLE
jgi:flavin-binding protein dodecin